MVPSVGINDSRVIHLQQLRFDIKQKQGLHHTREHCHFLFVGLLNIVNVFLLVSCHSILLRFWVVWALIRQWFIWNQNAQELLRIVFIPLRWLWSQNHFQLKQHLIEVSPYQWLDYLRRLCLHRPQLLLESGEHDFIVHILSRLEILACLFKERLLDLLQLEGCGYVRHCSWARAPTFNWMVISSELFDHDACSRILIAVGQCYLRLEFGRKMTNWLH